MILPKTSLGWDAAQVSYLIYTPNLNQPGTVYATTYAYDPRNLLDNVYINDTSQRMLDYQQDVNGQTLTMDTNDASGKNTIKAPHTRYLVFDGIQRGDVTNDGTTDVDYVTSIKDNTTQSGYGFFFHGSGTASPYADFSASYQPVNGLSVQGTASNYTVQDGDTLASIAQSIWGDSNLWYLIADANGLSGASQSLTAGTDLIIPNKVANYDNNSGTWRVYDPNAELGNTMPTHPPRPQSNHGCGIFGEILMVVVAVVVSVFTAGAALAALGLVEGGIGAGMGAVIGGTAFSALGGSVLGSVAGSIALGAVAGAAGSIASQGVGMAMGMQSKLDWGGVGMAAIAGGVSAGVGAEGGVFGQGTSGIIGDTGSIFGNAVLNGVATNMLTQGLEMATGLEKKFDWIGVAGAAVTSGVDEQLSNSGLNNLEIGAVGGVAGAVASATLRQVTSGGDFGDNLMRYLPNAIGQTIGNMIAGDLSGGLSATQANSAPQPGQANPDTPTQIGAAPLGPAVQVNTLPDIPTDGSTLSTDTTTGNTYRNYSNGTVQEWNSTTGSWGQPVEEVVVTAQRPSESVSDNSRLGWIQVASNGPLNGILASRNSEPTNHTVTVWIRPTATKSLLDPGHVALQFDHGQIIGHEPVEGVPGLQQVGESLIPLPGTVQAASESDFLYSVTIPVTEVQVAEMQAYVQINRNEDYQTFWENCAEFASNALAAGGVYTTFDSASKTVDPYSVVFIQPQEYTPVAFKDDLQAAGYTAVVHYWGGH